MDKWSVVKGNCEEYYFEGDFFTVTGPNITLPLVSLAIRPVDGQPVVASLPEQQKVAEKIARILNEHWEQEEGSDTSVVGGSVSQP